MVHHVSHTLFITYLTTYSAALHTNLTTDHLTTLLTSLFNSRHFSPRISPQHEHLSTVAKDAVHPRRWTHSWLSTRLMALSDWRYTSVKSPASCWVDRAWWVRTILSSVYLAWLCEKTH